MTMEIAERRERVDDSVDRTSAPRDIGTMKNERSLTATTDGPLGGCGWTPLERRSVSRVVRRVIAQCAQIQIILHTRSAH